MGTKCDEKNCQAWRVVDCADQAVGRVATRIADMLRGKDKPTFAPNRDGGDFVVAVNVGKIKLTGNKWEQKKYWNHSGFPGGIHGVTAAELHKKHPEEILRKAVKGMLPKNNLSAELITKLKIYQGATHPHQAQLAKTTTSS